jgi:hypothetical protein
MVQILIATHHADEALQLLQGPSLGKDSPIGRKDPQLHLTLVLDVLQRSEPRVAMDTCTSLLIQPEFQTDDRVWKVWLKAGPRSIHAGYVGFPKVPCC